MSASSATPTSQTCPNASTVVILREAPAGFEVFMVQRHAKSRFMADRFVYPGGKLDAADCTARAAERIDGRSAAEIQAAFGESSLHCSAKNGEQAPDAYLGSGLFLAGIRETFEEAGILLARRRGERGLIDLTSDAAVARRFRVHRQQLNRNTLALSALAEQEDLIFPLERIAYFAHWITPFHEPKRYDTRFFIALAPENQRPLHDDEETTDSTWIRPQDAIAANQAGNFLLAPPTRLTLLQLSEFDTARAAFDWAIAHTPPTIIPHMKMQEDAIFLLLPGDPDYPGDQPGYDATSPVRGATRMRAENIGLWRMIEDEDAP